ncbi:MAG: protein PilJ [Gammaproteobacteria bacterium]|nr:MAG: protein PilJ [Gammaproteobacteria bacterium]
MKLFKRPKMPRVRVARPQSWTMPVLGVLVTLSLVAMVAAFGYVYTQNKWNTEYFAYVAEQKLLSQRIATSALEAASGLDTAFAALAEFRARYQQLLDWLRDGNPMVTPPLPPLPRELAGPLDELTRIWEEYRENVDSIIDKRQPVADVARYVQTISEALPRLEKLSEEIALRMAETGADPQTLYVASRQSLFVERASNNLNRILTGGLDAAVAADQFGRDFAFFARVLDGLANGSRDLELQAATSPEAQAMIAEAQQIYNGLQGAVTGILDTSPLLFEVKDAAAQVQVIAPEILDAGVALENAIDRVLGQRVIQVAVAGGAAFVLTAVLLVIMALLQIRAARRRAAESVAINQRNQEAILRLLDEMTALAEGDLTAHATVTEDITGAIADSINFSIDALRSLVEAINRTVVRVSQAAAQTQAIANRLAEASNQQAAEIASVTESIAGMARAMEAMSSNAENVAEVALRSVEIAHKGAETVRRNIEGMDAIRETIQETSKRIKRLGESSQQIGEIVSLITDIADRTNILALNAAIQASSAGEAGRGFAVVADEVQRLAERAGAATKQIAALVETIQTDTHEAVSSMEQSTAGVVTGAKLAEDAGNALTEIEAVSKELAELITAISKEARTQASAAVNISQSMNVIKRITMETSEGTRETARAVGTLNELANELRRSVAGFKLPEQDGGTMRTAVNQ